jgi:uncharacterized membrane protein YoaK (UPF0700 family)
MTQTGRRNAFVVLLTAAAGATNVLSLTTLGGVPASIMTANLVLAGLSITQHEGALGWHAGAALGGFVVAVFGTLTDTVRDLTGPGPLRWSPGASRLVALVAGAAAEGAVLAYGQQRLGPLLPLVLVCGVAVLSLRGFSREG